MPDRQRALLLLLSDALPELVLERPAWTAEAECQGADMEIFFDKKDEGTAKAICEPCRTKDDCLSYALETNAQGVWGGTTDAERRSMRRGLPEVPCASCGAHFRPARTNQVCCTQECRDRWDAVVSARRRRTA